jgi:hypothetical protein
MQVDHVATTSAIPLAKVGSMARDDVPPSDLRFAMLLVAAS